MYLGGSPLNLVNVRSRPDLSSGRSTFPWDGNSIGVARYNQSSDSYTPYKVSNYRGESKVENTGDAYDAKEDGGPGELVASGKRNKSSISIFSRRDMPTRFTPYPRMDRDKFGDGSPDVEEGGIEVDRLHSDTLYDTSILNILKNLAGTKAELRAAHFAYLKEVGVYPNNRLIIARRFQDPGDSVTNLLRNGSPAISSMISWVKQSDDFFSIQFGEEWEGAEVDFTQVLNDLGDDFTKESGLGNKLAGGLGVVPLPGFTETFQRIVYTRMGILKPGSSSYIPAGEPNLIKEAKKRKTLSGPQPGSGLKCNFSVKFVCEWEQKFLSGIDPTIVWLDIIQSVLRFGTSNSVTFGFSSGAVEGLKDFVNDPMAALTRLLHGIATTLVDFRKRIDAYITKAKNALNRADNNVKEDPKEKTAEERSGLDQAGKDITGQGSGPDLFSASTAQNVGARLTTFVSKLLKNIIGKYKVRILGILHALSGLPSGPWHVTIGNPLRPIFSSGDMIIQDTVTLTLGPTLAFNDLPSSIKAEFTLTPARPLGLQEIFARFNSGHVRTVLQWPTGDEKESLVRALRIQPDGTEDLTSDDYKKEVNEKISTYYNSSSIVNPKVGKQKTDEQEESKPLESQSTQNSNSNSPVNNLQDSSVTSTTTTTTTTATTTPTTGLGADSPDKKLVISSNPNSKNLLV